MSMLQLEAVASELTIAKVKAGKAMCLFTQEILANAFTVRIQRKRYAVQSTMIGKGSVVVPSAPPGATRRRWRQGLRTPA